MNSDSSQAYKYISKDPFKEKIQYSYAEFRGESFVKEWMKLRKFVMDKLKSDATEVFDLQDITINNSQYLGYLNQTVTGVLLTGWIKELMTNGYEALRDNINLLLKRFEVTKHIHSEYNAEFRPLDKTTFTNEVNYLAFGCLIIVAYKKSRKLQYLNSLLKLNDIMCSGYDKLPIVGKSILFWLLEREVFIIRELIEKLQIKISEDII